MSQPGTLDTASTGRSSILRDIADRGPWYIIVPRSSAGRPRRPPHPHRRQARSPRSPDAAVVEPGLWITGRRDDETQHVARSTEYGSSSVASVRHVEATTVDQALSLKKPIDGRAGSSIETISLRKVMAAPSALSERPLRSDIDDSPNFPVLDSEWFRFASTFCEIVHHHVILLHRPPSFAWQSAQISIAALPAMGVAFAEAAR